MSSTEIDPKIVEACARVVHDIGFGLSGGKSWKRLHERQRAGTRAGVVHVLGGKTPEDMHAEWRARCLAEGWKYGPEKDVGRKEHPHLVDYADLPLERRRKDELFMSVTKAVAKSLGYEMMPKDEISGDFYVIVEQALRGFGLGRYADSPEKSQRFNEALEIVLEDFSKEAKL